MHFWNYSSRIAPRIPPGTLQRFFHWVFLDVLGGILKALPKESFEELMHESMNNFWEKVWKYFFVVFKVIFGRIPEVSRKFLRKKNRKNAWEKSSKTLKAILGKIYEFQGLIKRNYKTFSKNSPRVPLEFLKEFLKIVPKDSFRFFLSNSL